MRKARRRQGIVLPLVLIVALLLSAAILTFVRRSVVDSMMSRNRDAVASAEALCRGGIQLAMGMLVQERLDSQLAEPGSADAALAGMATPESAWAKAGDTLIETEAGHTLRVRIEDASARLNLNALVPAGREGEEGQPDEEAERFLADFLEKIIEEVAADRDPGQFDTREMAENLLDYMDADDTALDGRREDDYYAAQDPPYRAPNRPLLSVEEVALVEGFDVEIMEAMRPYVTVYPLLGQTGINLNTAPPHVLALVYHGSDDSRRLGDEELVRQVMKRRQEGQIVCSQTETDPSCVSLLELGLDDGSIYPPVELPMPATVFIVTAEAKVESVRRSVEAVIDVSNGADPRLLSWRVL